MIDIENLRCTFGNKTVLDNLSAQIEEGGFYAILGANGSGKTTLLRCIANILPATAGSIAIDGRDVHHYKPKELAQKLSLVRQQVHTDFEFSAFEIVLMGRNPYQSHLQNESYHDWEVVEQCMRQTNTWHLRLAKVHQMSGGELQRVMIARALAQQTPVMLLDEPISNLDIAHQYDIMELLRDINRREHKTILLVIHDLNLALRYCPSMLLLHRGGVLFRGATAEGLTPDNIRTVFRIEAGVQEEAGVRRLFFAPAKQT